MISVKNELFESEIDKCLKILKNGGVILYPTDTIWGIGCDATNEKAVSKIFKIKIRPPEKSMIILISDVDMLFEYVERVPPVAVDIVNSVRNPLSIIYPKAKNLPKNVVADDGSIAIRKVKNDFCQELIKRFGKPIVSTSANITGNPTPTRFRDISKTIINSMDYVVSIALDTNPEIKASTIARFTDDGEFEIIRD